MRKILFVIVFISLLSVISYANSVSVTTVKIQAQSGALTSIFFDTASGTTSTPATNTALTPSGSSSSFTIPTSTSDYLWSTQFTSATSISAGNWILDMWGAAQPYVPITITNSQTSATPNPFQEKITWNPSTYSSYEASNLGNIRFCSNSACSTELYAWLESCTPSCSTSATSASAWVKLTSAIAASGGTLTIYMVFTPIATNFDTNYWGEAPTLTGTYGQYDNGANVFTFYDNFAGTTLNAKWTSILGSSGATITVNNGLTVKTTSTAATAYGFVIGPSETYPTVAETDTTSGDSILGVATTTSVNSFVAPSVGYSINWASGTDHFTYQAATGSGTSLKTTTQATFPAGIWQVIWSAKAVQYFSDGAGTTYSGTHSGANIANYQIYIGQSNGVIASSVFDWARMRAYPPSNVMPTTAFGTTTSSGTMAVSVYVTSSTGTVQSTIASGILTSTITSSKSEYDMTFSGVQVTVPKNGYIAVVLASSSTVFNIYWGVGQPTNFQVPTVVLSS